MAWRATPGAAWTAPSSAAPATPARFERTDLPGAWEALRANAYVNDADHVMDNYTLRRPNPQSAMPMPMASNVDRRIRGGRVESEWRWDQVVVQAGLDSQQSRHPRPQRQRRGRVPERAVAYRRALRQSWRVH